MISKTPEQRRYYDARMKWERDEATRVALLEKANADFERGNAELAKVKIAHIHFLQNMLGEPLSNAETLRGMPLNSLDELNVELQAKVKSLVDPLR